MSDRYKEGLEICKKLFGEKFYEELCKTNTIMPEFERFAVEFAFAEIWSRPQLDAKTREFITLSSFITQGAFPQLKFHLKAALHLGITKQELLELILQLLPYTGFPTMSSALMVAKEVFEEN